MNQKANDSLPEAGSNVSSIAAALREVKKAAAQSSGAIEEAIADLNKKYARVRAGGQALVAMFVANGEVILTRQRDWLEITDAVSVPVVTPEGRPVTRDARTVWLNSPDAVRYEGVGVWPGHPLCVGGALNTWSGWRVEPVPGDCSYFLEFVHSVICSGRNADYEYLMDWLAHMFQRPLELPMVAVVLRGKEGTGKGQFVNLVGSIVGRHYLQVGDADSYLGQFNGLTRDATLLFCDEGSWGGNRVHNGKLKALITEPSRVINEKGVNQYSIPNRLRLILATNEEWAVNASQEARRFFVLDVSDHYMQHPTFFGEMRRKMQSEGGTAALLHFLLNRDILKFTPARAPTTEGLRSQQRLSLRLSEHSVELWLHSAAIEGRIAGVNWNDSLVIRRDVAYADYCNLTKSHPVHAAEFSKRLRRAGVLAEGGKSRVSADGSRQYVYEFKLRLEAALSPSLLLDDEDVQRVKEEVNEATKPAPNDQF